MGKKGRGRGRGTTYTLFGSGGTDAPKQDTTRDESASQEASRVLRGLYISDAAEPRGWEVPAAFAEVLDAMTRTETPDALVEMATGLLAAEPIDTKGWTEFLEAAIAKPVSTRRVIMDRSSWTCSELTKYINQMAAVWCGWAIEAARAPYSSPMTPCTDYPDGCCTEPLAVFVGAGNTERGVADIKEAVNRVTSTIDPVAFWSERIPGVFAETPPPPNLTVVKLNVKKPERHDHYVYFTLSVPTDCDAVADAIVDGIVSANTKTARPVSDREMCLSTVAPFIIPVDFGNPLLSPGAIIVKPGDLGSAIGKGGSNMAVIADELGRNNFKVSVTAVTGSPHGHGIVTIQRRKPGAELTAKTVAFIERAIRSPSADDDDFYFSCRY